MLKYFSAFQPTFIDSFLFSSPLHRHAMFIIFSEKHSATVHYFKVNEVSRTCLFTPGIRVCFYWEGKNTYPCEWGCVFPSGNAGKISCHTRSKRTASPLNAQSTNSQTLSIRNTPRHWSPPNQHNDDPWTSTVTLIHRSDMKWRKEKQTNKQKRPAKYLCCSLKMTSLSSDFLN